VHDLNRTAVREAEITAASVQAKNRKGEPPTAAVKKKAGLWGGD